MHLAVDISVSVDPAPAATNSGEEQHPDGRLRECKEPQCSSEAAPKPDDNRAKSGQEWIDREGQRLVLVRASPDEAEPISDALGEHQILLVTVTSSDCLFDLYERVHRLTT